ncbi:MAG: hypothetical protein J6Z49_08110 [Kiritimatiellae bacterium]|nr:hypothetical protein [Kiritimatiellia bacterium]
MSYLPKSIVERNVKRRVRTDGAGRERVGYEAYFGTDPFTKSAVRMTRASEDELKKDIKDFYQRLQSGGEAAVRLSPVEAIDARNALDLLREAGAKVSLADAVRGYLDGGAGRAADVHGVTVGDAYRTYFDAKLDGADKEKTARTVGKWVGCAGADTPLAAVTARGVDEYLREHYGARKPKTYNSHLQYIRTFLNWCCRDERKYLAENPIRNLKQRDEPWEEPEYMKPGDVERLFRLLEGERGRRPELLAYAVVSFFCGSRAVEIQRIASLGEDAVRINLDDETVRIAKGKGYQRGRRPRAFHIEPTAMAWMRSFDFMRAVRMVTPGTQGDIYRLARRNGVPVFQNCGRHSFITYHVAAYGDPAKTQAIVGTSAKMRAENYCGLASRADGEAYFRIMPSAVSGTEGRETA